MRSDSGWITLPLLALSIVVFAVVAAVAVDGAVRTRQERARREVEEVERAIEYALAVATERLCTTFEREPTPAPARVFADLDPVEFVSPSGSTWSIDLTIERSEVRERRDVLVRGESGERSRIVTVPVVYASDASDDELAEALASHDSSVSTEHERAALVRVLRDSSERGRAPTFTEWREELLASRSAALPMMSESKLRTWLDRIDPVARLRRTSLHPERLSGSDRGRHAAPGVVIALGYSGRFQVQLAASLSVRAGRPLRSFRPALAFQREVVLWTRHRVQSQASAWDACDLQPGGLEGAGLFIGPENREDRELAWDGIESDSGPLSSPATVASRRVRPLFGRGAIRWSNEGVELEPPWGVDRPSVRLGPLGTDVARIEGRLIVALETGELRLIDETGRRIRSRLFTAESIRLYELPLIGQVVAATDERWLVIDRELDDVASGSIESTFGAGTELEDSNGVDGLWAMDRAARRWVHASRSIDTGGWTVRRSAPGSAAPGVEFVGALPASPCAITRFGDRLTLWSVEDIGIRPRGSLVFPGDGGRLTLDPSGRGIWGWGGGDPVYRSFSFGRARHLDWGLQIVARPRRVQPRTGAAFVATGRESLSAEFRGEAIEPSGSVDSRSSVLDGPDLSDLTGRGVISAPERSEEWTFVSTASDSEARRALGAFDGSFGLTLEPSRSAAQIGSSDDAVVSRWTHRYRARFLPSAAWVAAHHPASLLVEEIASFSVTGPTTRTWTRHVELRRGPVDATWRLGRSSALSGVPWRIIVTRHSRHGAGAIELLDPWWVDDADLLPPAVECVVADDGSAGRAQSLRAHWTISQGAVGRLGLAMRSGEPSVTPVAPLPDSVELEPLGSTLSSGGDLGGRVFRGVIRDLWATSDPEASADREAPDRCRLRWVSPGLHPAGASLRRVVLEGSHSVRSRVEGSVRLVGARSRRVADLGSLDGVAAADALSLAEPFRVVLALSWIPSEADPVLIEAIDVETWEPPVGSEPLRIEAAIP